MTNAEIANVFNEIAARLREKKDSIFKIRAYEKAAKSIIETEVPIETLAAEKRLREVTGVGEAIEKKINELMNTGKLVYLEKLKTETSRNK
jgi:DNA polymerase (family X)